MREKCGKDVCCARRLLRHRNRTANRPPIRQQPTVTTARTTQPQSGFCSINNPTEINRLMRTVGSATDPETKSQLVVSISTTQKDKAKEQARPMARYISAAIQKSSRDM